MLYIIAAGMTFFVSGLLSLVLLRNQKLADAIGVFGALAGATAASIPAIACLAGATIEPFKQPWNIPLGSFSIAMDRLSAWFVLVIMVVCAIAAVYGYKYLQAYMGKKHLGAIWFFYNLLAAGMLFVVIARNGMLFLIAWEIMSLSSYFLVVVEDEKKKVRKAGWTYLVATHIGTAFLLVFFLLLGQGSGSLDFEAFSSFSESGQTLLDAAFILALIGFGTKAGFLLLHVWPPEAHPVAPSHVSAVMSGVMIKTGIYGLLRSFEFLGEGPAWWSWTLLCIGATSGIIGVIFALAQHDLKRLLAYHSVENIGIIVLGMGLGLFGLQNQQPVVMVLGFSGALLHVANHALFKSLLFLGAGAVKHATGTLEIERLGGLLKRMPKTGATFLTGSAAISGLPPLNGFISEFCIYASAFVLLTSGAEGGLAAGILTIGSLALIGGLAAACFTKAFGIVFLGEPRTPDADRAEEAGWPMRWSMLILASACLLIGLGAPLIFQLVQPIALELGHNALEPGAGSLVWFTDALIYITVGAGLFLMLVFLLGLLRAWLLSGREVTAAGTWGCGYVAPNTRMQYTASSFAQPITKLFAHGLQGQTHFEPPEGYFPKNTGFSTHYPDAFIAKLYRPLFLATDWAMSKLRWLQQGRIQLYVLYIGITLLALLIWKL